MKKAHKIILGIVGFLFVSGCTMFVTETPDSENKTSSTESTTLDKQLLCSWSTYDIKSNKQLSATCLTKIDINESSELTIRLLDINAEPIVAENLGNYSIVFTLLNENNEVEYTLEANGENGVIVVKNVTKQIKDRIIELYDSNKLLIGLVEPGNVQTCILINS
jgi:uncharacterized protein YceK